MRLCDFVEKDYFKEWFDEIADPNFKQPKPISRFNWFMLGLICGSIGMMIYMFWLFDNF